MNIECFARLSTRAALAIEYYLIKNSDQQMMPTNTLIHILDLTAMTGY